MAKDKNDNSKIRRWFLPDDAKELHKRLATATIVTLALFAGFLYRTYQDIQCLPKKFVTSECHDKVIDKSAYLQLKVDLEEYFETRKGQGALSDVSVFFRDLNDGPVMGVNEHAAFSSASLLKLPVVMTVLKLAEERPEVLDIDLIYGGENAPDIDQFYVPEEKIVKEGKYSVMEVIRHALVYSDNAAIAMLHDFLGIEGDEDNNVVSVFRELGLILPDDLQDRDVSTRSYAALFRLLYTSSYLNPDHSELILEHLSRGTFNGLRAGVPEGVTVASKFGERFHEDGTKQLHDCGIVYYPDNPYVLCVMTVGNDFAELQKTIVDTSRMVYEEVDSRRIND